MRLLSSFTMVFFISFKVLSNGVARAAPALPLDLGRERDPPVKDCSSGKPAWGVLQKLEESAAPINKRTLQMASGSLFQLSPCAPLPGSRPETYGSRTLRPRT